MKITRLITPEDLKRIKLAKSAYSNAITEINRAQALLLDAGIEHAYPMAVSHSFNELCALHQGLALDKMLTKTILITGVYQPENGNYRYNVHIWGQTNESPAIQLVTTHNGVYYGLDQLVKACKEIYLKYYGVSEYDIIHLDCIYRADF